MKTSVFDILHSQNYLRLTIRRKLLIHDVIDTPKDPKPIVNKVLWIWGLSGHIWDFVMGDSPMNNSPLSR